MPRTAEIHRQTGETKIDLWLDLDGTGAYEVATGVGFFDHMLAILSRHSLIMLPRVMPGILSRLSPPNATSSLH